MLPTYRTIVYATVASCWCTSAVALAVRALPTATSQPGTGASVQPAAHVWKKPDPIGTDEAAQENDHVDGWRQLEVYLLRHGETTVNAKPWLHHLVLDGLLDSKGLDQAVAARETLDTLAQIPTHSVVDFQAMEPSPFADIQSTTHCLSMPLRFPRSPRAPPFHRGLSLARSSLGLVILATVCAIGIHCCFTGAGYLRLCSGRSVRLLQMMAGGDSSFELFYGQALDRVQMPGGAVEDVRMVSMTDEVEFALDAAVNAVERGGALGSDVEVEELLATVAWPEADSADGKGLRLEFAVSGVVEDEALAVESPQSVALAVAGRSRRRRKSGYVVCVLVVGKESDISGSTTRIEELYLDGIAVELP